MPNHKFESINDLEAELKALIDSYERDGFSINVLKETHKRWKSSFIFVKRNENNEDHPRLYENKQIMESTKKVAAKYEKILYIKKKIKRKEKDALKNITNTTQRRALRDITSQNNVERRELAKETRPQDYIPRHTSEHRNHTTTNHNAN